MAAAPIIQAHYEALERIATLFDEHAQRTEQLTTQIAQRVDGLRGEGWVGRAADQFVAEMDNDVLPACRRLSAALAEANAVTLRIGEIFRAAEEEAAAPFMDVAGGGASGAGTSESATGGGGMAQADDANSSSLWDRILGVADKIVNVADLIDDLMPIPASLLVAASLQAGNSYPGQILVRAPQWLSRLGISRRWVKGLAGLAPSLSHIKATNLAGHLSRGARKLPVVGWAIAGGMGVVSVAQTWTERWDEYRGYDTPRRVSAMAVDAGLSLLPVAGEVGGGIAGVAVGAKIGGAVGGLLGGALGTMTLPVVGTVGGGAAGLAAGAVIGGAVGGFAGDWLGGKAGEWAQNQLMPYRDAAIDFVDNNVAQPVADGISAAYEGIRNIELPEFHFPDISLPSLSFGW